MHFFPAAFSFCAILFVFLVIVRTTVSLKKPADHGPPLCSPRKMTVGTGSKLPHGAGPTPVLNARARRISGASNAGSGLTSSRTCALKSRRWSCRSCGVAHPSRRELRSHERVAHMSNRKWVHGCRVWDYKDLCQVLPHKPSRLAMLKEFLERGFLVTNQPHQSDMDLSDATPSTSAAAVASTSETPALSSTPTPDPDTGTTDPLWLKDPVRRKMKATGMYLKFSADTVAIQDFKEHLQKHLDVRNCQQEVDNVSRFLRYMQPTGDVPTMDFLKKSTETRDFLQDLERADMSAATVLNYLKNILRYVRFLKHRVDLNDTNSDVRRQCENYTDFLHILRKPISRKNAKDHNTKNYDRFNKGMRSLQECQAVLRVAEQDFLKTYGKLVLEKDTVSGEHSKKQMTNYRYYLEAIMVLRQFQRPGAVEGMTVSEWINRKQHGEMAVIGIADHKTSATQIAAFAITQEEEAWFQAYFQHIRPIYVKNNPCDKFFVSTTGTKLHSVTSDLERLHASYNVVNTTSQEIRRITETKVSAVFTERQQEGVARYMAHSKAVADKNYRILQPAQVAETAVLLAKLSIWSPPQHPSGRGLRSHKEVL